MDDIKTVKTNKKINKLHEKQKNEIPNVIMNNEETPLNNEEEKDEIKNDNIENLKSDKFVESSVNSTIENGVAIITDVMELENNIIFNEFK